jgi:hypothetical protein
MPIKTSCSKCTFSFNAKDALAGKNVKCPRCQNPVRIPTSSQAAAAPVSAASGGSVRQPANRKLADLLDEVGVRATPKGPVCAACGEEMDPTAIICIACGYNVATGQYLETFTDTQYEADQATAGMTTGQRLLKKAEKEIEDSPIGAEDQDFGDGADSYIIAMIGLAVFSILILLGLAVVLIMESATEDFSPAIISVIASGCIYAGCGVFLTVVGFRIKPVHGIVSLVSVFLYSIVFGFMQGKGTILPAAIMIASLVIGAASGIYLALTGGG